MPLRAPSHESPPTGESWRPDPDLGPPPRSPANWRVPEPCQLTRPGPSPSHSANWPVPPGGLEPNRVPSDAQLPSPTRGGTASRQLASPGAPTTGTPEPRQLARAGDSCSFCQLRVHTTTTTAAGAMESRRLVDPGAPSPVLPEGPLHGAPSTGQGRGPGTEPLTARGQLWTLSRPPARLPKPCWPTGGLRAQEGKGHGRETRPPPPSKRPALPDPLVGGCQRQI